MTKLIQTEKIFKHRIFEITENGLKGQDKGLFKNTGYFVNFEDIGVKVLKTKSGARKWLYATLVFGFLTLIMLILKVAGGDVGKGSEIFYLCLTFVCGFIYWISSTDSFYLVQQGNKNAIEFFSNKPSKKELNDFIEELKSKRAETLKYKYGQINELLPYEQNYNSILWLFNCEAISKVEYDNKMIELNSLFKIQSKEKIGFKTE